MLKLISIPNDTKGSGILEYIVPESIGTAVLRTAKATFQSTVAALLDARLVVESANLDIKGAMSTVNVGATHQTTSNITWGQTGAYYVNIANGADYHHVPMQALEIRGGDVVRFIGAVTGAGEGWTSVSLWIDMDNDFR